MAASGRCPFLGLADAPAPGGADRCWTFSRARIPLAERKAEKDTGTFADLARQYVELHAKNTTRAGSRPSGWLAASDAAGAS